MINIREKLLLSAVEKLKKGEEIDLIFVRNVLLKHQKKVIRATLFSEYMKVSRFILKIKSFQSKTSLPIDILSLILIYNINDTCSYP